MREFQRPFQPIQMQLQQEPYVEEDAIDWGSSEWATPRYHIRQLLEHSIERLSVKDKAIILGAGNHGDVDLPAMANRFVEVTVVDSEDNVIDEVLSAGGGMAAGKIRSLTNIDYTCLNQIQFYETWEEMLLNQAPAAEVASYIKDCAFQVKRRSALPQWQHQCTLVVSSSVHTQLFYVHALSQFAGYASQYNEQEIPQIIDALRTLRNSLIGDYNRMLSSLLKPGGRIVMWTEMIQVQEQNRHLVEKLYQLQTEEERVRFLFRAFGEHGMEAAVVGLKELHDQLSPEDCLFKSWVGIAGQEKEYISAGFSGRLRG
ncbi:hypothetical protein ACFQ88_13765 [Paenibacillus sp. NPDC056579]|uniref:hypothetical protein n=1 Tax=Paenibacillus sp. NPDC056579 TaxID=3345871 RepID=UPI0036B4C757